MLYTYRIRIAVTPVEGRGLKPRFVFVRAESQGHATIIARGIALILRGRPLRRDELVDDVESTVVCRPAGSGRTASAEEITLEEAIILAQLKTEWD